MPPETRYANKGGPVARRAEPVLANLSTEQLEFLGDWYRKGRDLNERELERVKRLSF
jgi:hypothetical protein